MFSCFHLEISNPTSLIFIFLFCFVLLLRSVHAQSDVQCALTWWEQLRYVLRELKNVGKVLLIRANNLGVTKCT